MCVDEVGINHPIVYSDKLTSFLVYVEKNKVK